MKTEKIPDITFTYAIFNKQKSKLRFIEKSSLMIDLYPQFEGNEEFNSNYEYFNEISETWIGIGAGYLLNKNWSAGMSVFFSYRGEESSEILDNVVFDSDRNIVANTRFSTGYNFSQISMIFKFGVAYEDDYVSWGATITTTGIPTYLLNGAMLHRNENLSIPGESKHYYDIFHEWTYAWYRHPWEFDTGVQFNLGRGIINTRITYFLDNKPYNVTQFDDEAIINSNTGYSLFPNKNIVKYATKSMVNFALGYDGEINNKLVLLAGFKTDFNAFDSNKLSRDKYWVTTVSYWNLYNTTLGFDYKTEKNNNIIFGFSYKFSNRQGDTQIINITNPDPNNYLIGEKTNDTKTNITGFSIVIGYTFNFQSVEKKDIRDKIKLEKLNPFEIVK